ncbi:MAG: type IV pilus modification protein PilV [Porticoccaceae bacterium]|nr:type IV pilus modification protein PilV [Porticoccaceae bacterium]
MTNLKGLDYRQSGVSMIEVLIAILISVVGLFSVTKMQLSAVTNTHSAYLRSQAAVAANGMVDQLRANSSAAINGDYDLALTASAPISGGIEVVDLTQWRSDLAVILPSGVGSIACFSATQICSLVVQWDDSRGLAGGGSQQFSLTVRLQ